MQRWRRSRLRSGEVEAALATESAWHKDSDLQSYLEEQVKKKNSASNTLLLAFNCIGVIYGDIGTSPLYVLSSTFTEPPSKNQIYGIMSLVFWFLTIVVLIKYVGVVLSADHDGEGGTMAIYSLLCRSMQIMPARPLLEEESKRVLEAPVGKTHRWWNSPRAAHWLRQSVRRSSTAQLVLFLITVTATGMLIGDGIITPSISVLSAVGGLSNIPGSAGLKVDQGLITGVAVAILVVLFSFQFQGTKRVSFLFSPIIIVWLTFIFCVGAYNIHTYGGGDIFKTVNPYWAFHFLTTGGSKAWQMLAGVLLCITGTEAMYADLGHFNRRAIAFSCTFFVYPCLVIAYMGQSAFLTGGSIEDLGSDPPFTTADGEAVPVNAQLYYANIFWSSLPPGQGWLFAMLVVGNLAAVVASQAIITGAFSVIRQAINLGVFPRCKIHHTDPEHEGQIYIAPINWFLMILCIIITVAFGINSKTLGEPVELANAYGVAVTCVMFLTTVLTSVVMLMVWEFNPLIVAVFFLVFGAFDGNLVAATFTKIPHGGWFPLIVAGLIITVKLAWWSGSRTKLELSDAVAIKLSDLLALPQVPPTTEGTAAASGPPLNVSPLVQPTRGLCLLPSNAPVGRTPGLGIFYHEDPRPGTTPPQMRMLVSRMLAVNEAAIILSVRVLPLPVVPDEKKLLILPIQGLPDFYQVVARYGYTEIVDHSDTFMTNVVATINRKIEKGYLQTDRTDIFDPKADAARQTDPATGPQLSPEPADTWAINMPPPPGNNASLASRSAPVPKSYHLLGDRALLMDRKGSSAVPANLQLEELPLDAASPQSLTEEEAMKYKKLANERTHRLLDSMQRGGCIYYIARKRLSINTSQASERYNMVGLNPLTWVKIPGVLGDLCRMIWFSSIYGFLESNAYASSSSWKIPQDAMISINTPVRMDL